MIRIEVKPEVEARFAVVANAHGLDADSYAKSLIEEAASLDTPHAAGQSADDFLAEMAAFSDQIPALPEEAFARSTFYQDHD